MILPIPASHIGRRRHAARVTAAGLDTLGAMPEDDIDPIASTQMFRRFAAGPEPAARRRGDPRILVALVLLALALAGVAVWLIAS